MIELTKYQVESIVLNRSEIKNAPYNPRTISDAAAKKIRKNIKDRGLMGGIVVNRRTMHLVAGHQRLAQLDLLEKGQDYQIRVEMVDLTDQEEKEQNIFMNNQSVMGDFDQALLSDIIHDIDYQAAGFDQYDLNILGINLEMESNTDSLVEDLKQVAKPIEEKKAHVKEMKKQVAEKAQATVQEGESYFMVSFDSFANKAAFMQRFGFDPSDKFIKGEVFENMIERVE